jgi:hypothetical protein
MKDLAGVATRSFGVLIGLLLFGQSTLAQCAMCRASIANSDNPAQASSAINAGILVLLLPTLALIAALAVLVIRYHRADSSQSGNSGPLTQAAASSMWSCLLRAETRIGPDDELIELLLSCRLAPEHRSNNCSKESDRNADDAGILEREERSAQ